MDTGNARRVLSQSSPSPLSQTTQDFRPRGHQTHRTHGNNFDARKSRLTLGPGAVSLRADTERHLTSFPASLAAGTASRAPAARSPRVTAGRRPPLPAGGSREARPGRSRRGTAGPPGFVSSLQRGRPCPDPGTHPPPRPAPPAPLTDGPMTGAQLRQCQRYELPG